jgi:hypothetical protein
MKLKGLDSECTRFSLGEISCAFAGRFDLFVFSFVGKLNDNRHSGLGVDNLSGQSWEERGPGKLSSAGSRSRCDRGELFRSQRGRGCSGRLQRGLGKICPVV